MNNFKCSKCGCDSIEEVMEDVTVTSVLTKILLSDGDLEFEYDDDLRSTEGGDHDTIRYQCTSCGKEVTREQMEALAKVECDDCGNDFDTEDIKPWKYEPGVKLCLDCYSDRMEEPD